MRSRAQLVSGGTSKALNVGVVRTRHMPSLRRSQGRLRLSVPPAPIPGETFRTIGTLTRTLTSGFYVLNAYDPRFIYIPQMGVRAVHCC